MDPWKLIRGNEDDESVLPRRPVRDDVELDITPMIDVTFLLLIFFLVTSVPTVQAALELPPARHGVGVSRRTSVIISVAERGGPGPAKVYLGDGKVGEPLSDDPARQEEQIRQAVEQGRRQGWNSVLIKAEKRVLHRDVARIAAAAGAAGEVQLNLAVLEIE